MREHHDTISQYKMLAGVVMTQGTGQEAVVICVTSGTKCISGGNLSLEGETLNDCHAEILARRCLVQFFYDQLQTFKINSSNSIFEAGSCGRLKLKKDIFFHLYVSSSPCGDSRIFTLNDKTSGNRSVRDPHPRRLGRGVLRTKIEWGVGNKSLKTLFTTYGIMRPSMFDRDGSGIHPNSNLGWHHVR
jgi:double stranded RNA-specific editase B